MSCLPTTPTTNNVLTDTVSSNTDGWLNITSVSTSALTQYYPVQSTPTVLTFNGVFQTTFQHGRVLQLQIEETASSSANVLCASPANSRGTKIGTVADTSAPTSCSQHPRLHVEMGNTNNYSCFARDLHTGRPWGDAVRRGDFIGWVGGRRATGSRQHCPY